jgi:hypothetical protein
MRPWRVSTWTVLRWHFSPWEIAVLGVTWLVTALVRYGDRDVG